MASNNNDNRKTMSEVVCNQCQGSSKGKDGKPCAACGGTGVRKDQRGHLVTK